MADIKWIKITTDIFDDDKIKIIDRMPARDEILVIWFKLLALAGKTNQSGLLFMSNKIPYTTDMLSAIFNREENSVKMALMTFEKFGMIHIENNDVITISNWDKHQNVDGMEKIREQNRIRVQNHRNKLSQLTCNVTSNVTVTECNAIDKEEEKKKEKEKEKKSNTIIKFPEESYEYQLSLFLYHKILNTNPNFKKPNLESWSKYIDELIRIDKCSVERIRDVIEWCQQDDFWKTNILSTQKLRKQFMTLETKMLTKPKSKFEKQVDDMNDWVRRMEAEQNGR